MEDTAAIQDRIAGIVMDKVPETEQIYYSTGDSTSIMSSASGASVTVSLVDLDKRDRSAQEITKQLRRDLRTSPAVRSRSPQANPWACPPTRTSALS